MTMYECQNCNSTFKEKPSCANKYCSKDCYYAARWGAKRPWADCSNCLASIGFGKRITGQILGVKPATILSQRKRDGIKTNTPPMGSWYIWAKRKTAGKNPDRKRTACEVAYEQARMEDIKQAHSNGHTWGYVWTKEKARRIASDKYNSMTPEEKKEHNTRCMNNRKKLWAKNPELKIKQYERKKKWRKKNKNKLNKYNKEWNKNNPGRSYQYAKKRMKSDPAFRALENQRKRFRSIMKSVKNGGTGSYSSKIGCTTKEFHNYMEAKFKPGMSWDNYGTYWHVDHIIPCAAFDHTDPKQVALCWHHSNMQPLEARENLLKSDKFDEEQLSLLINYTNQDT